MHHKFGDTDKDPYSVTHGFWWAHIGWLMFSKGKACLEMGQKLEADGAFDDLKSQPLVRIQHKWYGLFFLGCAYLQPLLLCALWGDAWNGMWVAGGLPLMWFVRPAVALPAEHAFAGASRAPCSSTRWRTCGASARTTPRSPPCRTSSLPS